MDDVAGARMLDLFAASGIVGLEALSRGANWCGFVETERGAVAVLQENLRVFDVKARSAVLCASLPTALARLPSSWPRRFDLAFADPPYAFADYGGLLRAVAPLLEAAGVVGVEHAASTDLSSCAQGGGLEWVESRRYGDSALTWFRPEG